MAARNWMKSVPTTSFATYGFSKSIPRRPVMVSEGFQRGLKPSLFFQRMLRNGCRIRFESYGGSKFEEIGPDDLFCYIRLLQVHPEASTDGFRGLSQRGLKPSKGFEMAVGFVLNHMAARNWMKSLPTTCFAIYTASPRPSRGVQ